MRSEPVADNSGKVVKDMVSSSMRDLIYSSDKDSFILFYKPDCQHCRDFMPTWNNLGEALKVITRKWFSGYIWKEFISGWRNWCSEDEFKRKWDSPRIQDGILCQGISLNVFQGTSINVINRNMLCCQPREESGEPTSQYVGSRTLKSLIQFVTSQVSITM